MSLSELLFRLENSIEYVYAINGIQYESFVDIPDELFTKEVYMWSFDGGVNIKIINITTIANDVSQVMHDEMGMFPEFTEEQVVQMIKSGVTLLDVINDYSEEIVDNE